MQKLKLGMASLVVFSAVAMLAIIPAHAASQPNNLYAGLLGNTNYQNSFGASDFPGVGNTATQEFPQYITALLISTNPGSATITANGHTVAQDFPIANGHAFVNWTEAPGFYDINITLQDNQGSSATYNFPIQVLSQVTYVSYLQNKQQTLFGLTLEEWAVVAGTLPIGGALFWALGDTHGEATKKVAMLKYGGQRTA